MRRFAFGATLALAWLAAARPARANLEPGAVAPAFEPKEFVNCEETSLARLRGRVVLYDIFRTW
jgi:hypothetical protein